MIYECCSVLECLNLLPTAHSSSITVPVTAPLDVQCALEDVESLVCVCVCVLLNLYTYKIYDDYNKVIKTCMHLIVLVGQYIFQLVAHILLGQNLHHCVDGFRKHVFKCIGIKRKRISININII